MGRVEKAFPRVPACFFPKPSTLFSHMGCPLRRGCGLRIIQVYNVDADYQDYRLILRLPNFDVKSPWGPVDIC